jgi:hypothetical protein
VRIRDGPAAVTPPGGKFRETRLACKDHCAVRAAREGRRRSRGVRRRSALPELRIRWQRVLTARCELLEPFLFCGDVDDGYVEHPGGGNRQVSIFAACGSAAAARRGAHPARGDGAVPDRPQADPSRAPRSAPAADPRRGSGGRNRRKRRERFRIRMRGSRLCLPGAMARELPRLPLRG